MKALAHALEGRSGCVPAWLLALAVGLAAPTLPAQDDGPMTRLFDSVLSSTEPAEELIAGRNHWRQVPEEDVGHPFSGDAMLLNDKLAVVVRRQGPGIEVCSRMTGRPRRRAWLGHTGGPGSSLDPPDRLRIVQNTESSVVVEAAFKGSAAAVLRLRLTTGEAILEVQCAEGAGFVEVRSPARYVVVPDYFGDDLIYGGRGTGEFWLPAENFCLNLLEGQEAMMMSVWQSGGPEAWLGFTTLAATGENPGLASSTRVRCLKGKSLWLAFLESPGLWHSRSGLAEDGWKPPFPAKWRTTFARGNGLADSWDLDRGPGAEQTEGAHAGPLVIYPLDRSTATPLTATCPTDVMRNTLGLGPCQYILACEGMAAEGDPTPNSVATWVEKQFEQKRQNKAGDEIKERLEQMVKHVAEARARIERYLQFAARLRGASGPKPELFSAIADDIERAAASGTAAAAAPERARELAAEVAALLGQTNAVPACQRLAKEIRAIGAAQDRALAKCRMNVRRAGQPARTLAATSPLDNGAGQQVLRLIEQALQNK